MREGIVKEKIVLLSMSQGNAKLQLEPSISDRKRIVVFYDKKLEKSQKLHQLPIFILTVQRV